MIDNIKIIAIFLFPFCIVLFTTACTSKNISPEANTGIYEEKENGSFKKGGFMYSDYWIDLECPNTGHPSGSIDSLWSTYYEDQTGEQVDVNIFGMQGDFDSLINELVVSGIEVTKGVLWNNDCYFYIDDMTVAIIPLGKKDYLQITFGDSDGVVIDSSSIPNTFTMNITQVYVREEE